MPLRITTWNVNGIRNPFGYHPWRENRTFDSMFDILDADIVVMQELKIQRKDLRDDMVMVPGWDCFFSLPKHKKGYSGVAVYTRQSKCSPIRAEEGVLGVLPAPTTTVAYRDWPEDKAIGGYPSEAQLEQIGVDPAMLDAEGRCVVVEFPAFVLIGVYSPANSNGLRDDFRAGFLLALDARIRNLYKLGKRVILLGDLNVSRNELDTAGAEDDKRKAGISHEEYISTPNRRIFNQLLDGGDVFGERDPGREQPMLWDACRAFHEGRIGMYTHWEQKINARPGNYGSRIDYVLCSISMKSWVADSNIQEGLMGSDHCPVYMTLNDEVKVDDMTVPLADFMNKDGIFINGVRMRDLELRDSPAFSGRLLPEFDKRRNIKDMFKKRTSDLGTMGDIGPPTLPSESPAQSPVKAQPAPLPEGGQLQPSINFSKPVKESATLKRKISALSDNTSPKHKKSSNGKSVGKTNDQTNLKAFFKPAGAKQAAPVSNQTRAPSNGPDGSETTLQEPDDSFTTHQISNTPGKAFSNDEWKEDSREFRQKPLDSRLSQIPSAPETFDPEATRQMNTAEWRSLFTKKPGPLCEGHNEPCTRLDTKKKGFNCGRSFWICKRPVGPSGTKESGTEWRCKTFIWSSDWNSTANTPNGS